MSAIRERIPLPVGQSFRLLRWRKNLRDVELVLSPQRSVSIVGEGEHWHYHEAFELTFFEAGEGTRFVGDQIQPFQRGDLVLLGANLPHYWHTRGQSSGWSVQWHLPPTHHFWAFPEAEMLGAYFKSAARGIQFHGPTAEVLSAQLPQLAATDGLDRLGLLLRLLATAATAPVRDQAFISVNSFSLSVASRHQTAMQATIRFLLENFRREIRLREILAVSQMSKPTFSRQFKKHSGKTLGEFLQQIRLDAACRELTETDHSVIDVALGNGFSQVSFFNRVFRRALRCNPSDYRRHGWRRGFTAPGAPIRR
ncbi:MAG: AraC family transcriptional regulator [Opitutaceae bacterium]|nr:AraC family transcriptional regulator [Opitutaceae bacterium]